MQCFHCGQSSPRVRWQKPGVTTSQPLPSPAAALRLHGTWFEPSGLQNIVKGRTSLELIPCWLCSGDRLVFSLMSARSPSSSSAELLPSQAVPACTSAGHSAVPGGGLCICPCWIWWGPCQPISQACLGPSECQSCPRRCRLQPPSLASSAK